MTGKRVIASLPAAPAPTPVMPAQAGISRRLSKGGEILAGAGMTGVGFKRNPPSSMPLCAIRLAQE